MPLIIDDEVLHEAKLTEADARLEIASRLFAVGRLSLESAAKLAHLEADEFLTRSSVNHAGVKDQALDDQYAAGYAKIPEDPSDSSALLPYLVSPDEGWE